MEAGFDAAALDDGERAEMGRVVGRELLVATIEMFAKQRRKLYGCVVDGVDGFFRAIDQGAWYRRGALKGSV